MNGEMIRKQIDTNNAKIQQLLNRFVLTEEIKQLMKENDHLRAQCKHHFVDGTCEYCDAFEGAIYDD